MAVCADGWGRALGCDRRLASLAAKSMVGTERSGDTTRYQLLETLRHFARDRSGTTGDLDGLRRLHALFFAGFAQRAGAGVMSDQELVWQPRLAAEMDNLRAATGWALDAADVDDVGLGVAILAGLAGEALLRLGTGIQAWATAGVGRADELDAAHRTVLLGLSAYDAFLLGQFERAATLGGQAIAESDTFTPVLCATVLAVSFSALARGDPARAMAVLADGRARLDAAGANDWTAAYLAGIASLAARVSGDDDTARAQAAPGLAVARRVGAPSLLAGALWLHAFAVCDDHPDEALAAAGESVRLTEAGAGDSGYSAALSLGAIIRAGAGDHAGAARDLRTAIVHEAGTGNRVGMAAAVNRTALVLACRPDTFEAAATLAGAVAGPVLGVFPAYLTQPQEDRYRQRLAEGVATLGAERYADAQQRGAAMTYDEIIAYTLDQLDLLADL